MIIILHSATFGKKIGAVANKTLRKIRIIVDIYLKFAKKKPTVRAAKDDFSFVTTQSRL